MVDLARPPPTEPAAGDDLATRATAADGPLLRAGGYCVAVAAAHLAMAAGIAVGAGAGYRAVAFDQRGYSPRVRPAEVEQYRIGHLVDDALAVAGPQPFHVVGHDFGAVVAWHLAAKHAERILTLTRCRCPIPRAGVAGERSAVEVERHRFPPYDRCGRGPAARRRLGGDARRVRLPGRHRRAGRGHVRTRAPPGALNWYRAIDFDPVRGVHGITVPTLYVWSTGDVALARESAEASARHVDGPYRFEVLQGVSHWIPEEVPEELNRLLLEHLAAQ